MTRWFFVENASISSLVHIVAIQQLKHTKDTDIINQAKSSNTNQIQFQLGNNNFCTAPIILDPRVPAVPGGWQRHPRAAAC